MESGVTKLFLLLCNMYRCKWTEFYHIICSCTCMHWFCSLNNGSLLILRACQFSIHTLNLSEKTSTGGSPFFLICREFHSQWSIVHIFSSIQMSQFLAVAVLCPNFSAICTLNRFLCILTTFKCYIL
jgi:hypothetical protein